MKNINIKLIAVAILITLNSCTDATKAKMGGYGDEHKVEMYSGGKLVKEWVATGKVQSESNSDGYYFNDKETGKLVEVSGDIVITKF